MTDHRQRAAGSRPGEVLLQETRPDGTGLWLHFRRPVEVLTATRPEEIRPLLATAREANRNGLWAAGFLTYEAAPAFDPALTTHAGGLLPLVWLGLFEPPREVASPPGGDGSFEISDWRPSLSAEDYAGAISSIHRLIARGDTYQVNFTMRLEASFRGDPETFLHRLLGAQRSNYCAYIDLGRHVIVSASPELFFRLDGERIVSRPMKGTAQRGLDAVGDERRRAWLAASSKNRAENLMIVDMIRNDLGRIARPGSVGVSRLFEIERYPSLFQMTSTVEATTGAEVDEVLAALFPCASITGAPKVRSMEIIAELESGPRGIYTGGIGYLAPGRRAQFNVAIRTVHIDRRRELAVYGTGGGIVWDSEADEEYRECRTKALVLGRPQPDFQLLETLLWTPGEGYRLLDRHLDRLTASAAYFDLPCDRQRILRQLERLAGELRGRSRVRLRVDAAGRARLEAAEMPTATRTWRVRLATRAIDPGDLFLYHKTTHRRVYDDARARQPDCDDVLLWNPAGELTESTLANLVLDLDGCKLTPPIACGLLPGTLRAELLKRGEIQEKVLTRDDLNRADGIFLINSVRGWIPAELAEPDGI